jgi:hypothetical protein
MQMTLFQLNQILALIETIQHESMSARLAFILINFYEKNKEHRDFYLKKLNEILQENVEKDVNGEMIVREQNPVFNANSVEKYNSQVQELSQTLVETSCLRFKLSDLEGVKLSIAQMSLLRDFIE